MSGEGFGGEHDDWNSFPRPPPGERRVALVPESVARLIKGGATVLVQRGAELGGCMTVRTLRTSRPGRNSQLMPMRFTAKRTS